MLTNFLINIFIKDKDNIKDIDVRNKYGMLSSVFGITANIVLFLGKLLVGIISNSVAIIADALNNISDAGSSLITMLGLHLSGKHADKEHPLGHGRMEYITAFVVDIMIILVGIELFKSAFSKILHPTDTQMTSASFFVLLIAILIKLWMYFVYNKIGKVINSAPIKASALDSISDVIATSVVFVSAIISKLYAVNLDGWAGLLVAGFIIFSGFKATFETMELLIGSTPSDELVGEIYDFIKNYPDIVGIHDLMIHDYGPGRQIFTFHAEVNEDINLLYAHDIVDFMERDMQKHFGCIVTIHLDPISVGNEKVDKMKKIAEECAWEIDRDFTIHDFRITYSEQNVNMIFDLCIPVDSKYDEREAEILVQNLICSKDEKYHAVIHAEHPFI